MPAKMGGMRMPKGMRKATGMRPKATPPMPMSPSMGVPSSPNMGYKKGGVVKRRKK